ncbi:MAG: glycosyltransferase [Thermoanaerobaculaceae bacterium]|jgi:hypothetical protein|nr:glycosyltransferase [Thermoanaerobaculaceae bacterium]
MDIRDGVTADQTARLEAELESSRRQLAWLRRELGVSLAEVQDLREELGGLVGSRWTPVIAAHRRMRAWLRRRLGRGGSGAAGPGGGILRSLPEVLHRVEASRGVVVFLPSIGWDIVLYQRPHHLARCFAEAGFVSVFASGSRRPFGTDGFREVAPNLLVHTGPLAELRSLPRPLLWAFTYNYHLRDTLPDAAGVVYDWIDDLSVFPHPQRLLARNHARALGEATVVTSVARRLHEQALAERPDALYVPNGVEVGRFAPGVAPEVSEPALDRLRASGKPVLGYYGALASWFDYELLRQVATLRPDWELLLVGPRHDASSDRSPLWACPNVTWLGPREYRLLPAFVDRFDVACIPFKINQISVSTSPLKLFEYFSAGKPVITTAMPECQAFPEVFVAHDAAGFGAALDEARLAGRRPDYLARLATLAAESSWRQRVETVTSRLREAMPDWVR